MHCILSFLTLNTERLLIVLGFYTLFVVDIFDICGCLSLNCIACYLACYRHKLFIAVACLINFYRVDIYAGYGNSEIFTKSFSYVVFYLVVDKSNLAFNLDNRNVIFSRSGCYRIFDIPADSIFYLLVEVIR